MSGHRTLMLISVVACAAAAMVPSAVAQTTSPPRTLAIGTASPGGPYYVYGEALARIIHRTLGVEATAQVTQGPAQNIVLLEKKEVMLGFITAGAALQGWNGTDWAKGISYRTMRVIFPMFDTAFQIVTLKTTNLKSIDQLADKRVGVGPRAGTAGTYMPEIFKSLGFSTVVRHGSWDDMKIQALAGELDAIAFVGGVPFPALTELNTVQPVEFIVPSRGQVEIIRKAMPEISASVVSKGAYPSLMADYPTVGLFNFAVAHKDLPDELAYGIVKAVFQNNTELVQAQASAKETVPANIRHNNVLPLHPGAERYYREQGVAVPAQAQNK